MLTSCPPLRRSSLFRRHRCLHAAETNVHRLANACSVDVEIMCIKKKLFLLFQTMASAYTGVYFNGCAPGSRTGLALPDCERG
jgi:hypothetical protein